MGGRVRAQIDSGAIDAVGPKEIAMAFEMKETEMSKRGTRYIVASGGSVKNHVETNAYRATQTTEKV